MITKQKLQEWQKQNAKDIEQFRKDEQRMKLTEIDRSDSMRKFFERMRAKYFNFKSEETDKLNRLLSYTEVGTEIQNYPKIMNTYLTYNFSSIVVFAVCLFAPKKVFSKIIISLIAYGIKSNITDGLFTYYMVESIALGTNMTEKEQQLRNVLQFYYMHRKFTSKLMTEQQEKKAQSLLQDIRKLNEKYTNFKRVEKLL